MQAVERDTPCTSMLQAVDRDTHFTSMQAVERDTPCTSMLQAVDRDTHFTSMQAVEREGGQREGRGATVYKYSSFAHGDNSSQAGSKIPTMSEFISSL